MSYDKKNVFLLDEAKNGSLHCDNQNTYFDLLNDLLNDDYY